MKLNEIVELRPTDEQLDEVDVRKALATGALTLSTLFAPANITQHSIPKQEVVQQQPASSRDELDAAVLANAIVKKYSHVSPQFAMRVAQLAKKHEKDVFPKAEDILAIVGIESSFNPKAVSRLRRDPAVGLMQVRPGVWGLNRGELANSIDKQIALGSKILNKYYNILGDKATAVHAYNVGLGNLKRGKHNIDYVHKYEKELRLYDI